MSYLPLVDLPSDYNKLSGILSDGILSVILADKIESRDHPSLKKDALMERIESLNVYMPTIFLHPMNIMKQTNHCLRTIGSGLEKQL